MRLILAILSFSLITSNAHAFGGVVPGVPGAPAAKAAGSASAGAAVAVGIGVVYTSVYLYCEYQASGNGGWREAPDGSYWVKPGRKGGGCASTRGAAEAWNSSMGDGSPPNPWDDSLKFSDD